MPTKVSTITAEFKAIQSALKALDPLDETQRQFAVSMILARLGMPKTGASTGDAGAETGSGGAETAGVGGGRAKLREFLKQKNPITDLERYLCLAYYLTHQMKTPIFASKEIIKLNGEGGGADFSNAAMTAANATRQSKLLSKAGGGKKRVTLRGEQLVEALPDRTKAREITKSRTIRKRPKKPTKK